MPPVEEAESASLGRSRHVGGPGGGAVVSALVVGGRSLVAFPVDGMVSVRKLSDTCVERTGLLRMKVLKYLLFLEASMLFCPLLRPWISPRFYRRNCLPAIATLILFLHSWLLLLSKMLDGFEILTTSGVVLWSKAYAPVSSSIINGFIKDVFIEEKVLPGASVADEASAAHNPTYKKDQYTLKWATVKDLGLIFVVCML